MFNSCGGRGTSRQRERDLRSARTCSMAPVEAHSGREPHLTEQMEAAFLAALDALDRILVLREQFAASLRQVSRESRHERKDNECRITQEWLKTIVPRAMYL